MASSSVGDNQLQRIIKDLQDAVFELSKEYQECGEPISDDSANLHKFFFKLEYLLQFDQKEKTTFLGQRKDYWDYFCDCLIKIKGANDGIRFVKSIPELKTSLGKGRAFIRYSLVHQRLADTLQQCLINQKVTSEWFYDRSPFLKSHLTADIINNLYELNQIHFDVAARGYDLDADWPKFARRTISTPSAFLWKPPSRCSSINSLVSSYSHLQPQEGFPVSDLSHSLLGELGEPSPCNIAESLRIELDQSELRQQELLEQVQKLNREASELKNVVEDLQGTLLVVQRSTPNHQTSDQESPNQLPPCKEAINAELQVRLTAAEKKNMELITKLDEALKEKGQQTASYCNSAWKIQDLLEKLKTAEEEKLDSKREAEDRARQCERLSQELRLREEEDDALRRLEELQSAVSRIQGALTLKEKEAGNLRAQLQDLQTSLECRERQAEELRKRLQEEREEEEQRCSTKELATSSERIKHLEEKLEKLAGLADNDDVSCSQTPNQLAYLRASEKHLKRRIEATNMCVEDRERKLLDDNLHLEEILQKTLVEKEAFECQIKKLEHANRELVESQSSLKKLLKTTQQELDSLTAKIVLLDKNLTVSQRSQAELLEKIQEAEAKLCDQTFERGLLQARVDELERRSVDMHDEKGAAESNEKMQKPDTERGSPPMESKETPFRLVIAEAQLELNLREVQRLQEEVVELRAQLLAGNEERMKVQALQEVTESSREDLRVLTEQLKAQVEDLNRRHVDEILRSREREEALIRERDGEAQARAGLATEVTTCREDFNKLKVRYDALSLENSDSREALHRANTEMAELGVHVCMLTAENEEARLRWEGLTTRLEELKEEAARDVESQKAYIEQLRQENQQLLHEVQNKERLLEAKEELQVELNKTQREAEAVREKSQGEIQSLNVQLSNESLIHRSQLQVSLNSASVFLPKLLELLSLLKVFVLVCRSEGDLAVAQKVCQEMSDNLRRLTQDKQTIDLRTAAELDDLYRTKINLEERLVELIREKDALWQKNDALEFEQKLRDEETERDVNHCVGCHTQFSWWLRKYNCRLCGRPFCYYCCSNNVSTQPGGSRERCCVHCYNQHSAVVERHPQEEVSNSAPGTPFSRLLHAGRALTTAPDCQEFCTIACTVCSRSDHVSRSNSASTGDIASEDVEDVSAAVQDAEIYLLKSGELTLDVHFTVDDISGFEDSCRDLFIKSSCYSTISIIMKAPGPTVTWTFTSEPKSISFSVVYRESTDTPLEQAKVLIPLTRCNAHKETIQGELKVRNSGEYTLIFDNSFSRFISKKVLYHLSLDKPVVYDGTDLL
uniref:FYVE and coiled-coil domain autophagy adaptor 1 n=1 Tax=Takifugu rubripes TaxID=31033 RepID=A0A674MZL3_TAKRU